MFPRDTRTSDSILSYLVNVIETKSLYLSLITNSKNGSTPMVDRYITKARVILAYKMGNRKSKNYFNLRTHKLPFSDLFAKTIMHLNDILPLICVQALGDNILGVRLVSLIYGRRTRVPSRSSIGRFSTLVKPCSGLFLFMPTFPSSGFLITLLLLLLFMLLPLAVSMRVECCVAYTHHAWDLHSFSTC